MVMSLLGTGTAGTYRISANTDEGWLSTGNSGQNPANLFLLSSAAMPLIIATIAIPSLLRSRQAANESSAIARLRTIATAEVTYAATRGNYGDMTSLIASRLIDASFSTTVAGYEFSITLSGRNYTATATPASSNSGRYGYYITGEGVVRYSLTPNLAPAGMSGQPVQ